MGCRVLYLCLGFGLGGLGHGILVGGFQVGGLVLDCGHWVVDIKFGIRRFEV